MEVTWLFGVFDLDLFRLTVVIYLSLSKPHRLCIALVFWCMRFSTLSVGHRDLAALVEPLTKLVDGTAVLSRELIIKIDIPIWVIHNLVTGFLVTCGSRGGIDVKLYATISCCGIARCPW
jgi:hypothetical protein